MGLPPRIVTANQNHVIAAWYNVVMTRWVGRVELSALETAAMLGRQMAPDFDNKLVAISLVENGVSIPERDVRKRAAELMAAAEDYMALNVTILSGRGFWSAAARTALNGIILLAYGGSPHWVFDSINEASLRILPYVQAPDITAGGVLRAIESLRR